MIVSLRRLVKTERVRLLLVLVAIVLWNFLLLAVLKEAGAASLKGSQDMGAISKGFDIRAVTTDNALIANLVGIAFTHPLFLAMAGSIALALGARSCAGELQAGTLELTLSRPLSRRGYLLSYMIYIGLALLVAMAVAALTVLVGSALLDTDGRIDAWPMAQAAFLAWLLFMALGGLATAISTFTSSRSSAFLGSLVALVGTYFLEFFARIWEPVEPLGPLSPFHYFVPTDTLLGLGMDVGDAIALAAIAIGANLIAMVRFQHRDLV